MEKQRKILHERDARHDVKLMANQTERAVFNFLHKRLMDKIPDATIRYESVFFQVKHPGSTKIGTLPDFLIIKPDGTEVFIEVTSREASCKNKARDQVMRHFPDVKYVVLHRDVIKTIEASNPREKLLYPGGK